MILGGMAKSKSPSSNDQPLGDQDKILEELRRHPVLMERVEAILKLINKGEATADQTEVMLVEELRRLGIDSMESWAVNAEEETAEEFKRENPDARYGKKND